MYIKGNHFILESEYSLFEERIYRYLHKLTFILEKTFLKTLIGICLNLSGIVISESMPQYHELY